ncbi:hypothetical protein ATI61_110170 [Archangium gephyra]|uniref:Acyltransferase family protein n=1 Tax=Archangium gephyra TaxID=48 RepID=A0AAC8QET5_9BACT|nr:hypothetical protein [Archangium gephyra]AKJ06084.1 acyltransferase family protein [Archangium gephyra]REG27163.1 hypothetical protein ATI61_110170 [Archangium gephyra]
MARDYRRAWLPFVLNSLRYIVRRTGTPIVPVTSVGAEETAPLFGKIPASFLGIPYLPLTSPPLPGWWTIRFGDPRRMGELPPEAAEDMS